MFSYDLTITPVKVTLSTPTIPIPNPPHPTTIPDSEIPLWWLEGFPLRQECLSERCGLGSSGEEGTSHGDLGLATGDGGASQRRGALSPAYGRAAHLDLGLVPFDGSVAQIEGRPALGDAGVPHGTSGC